MLRDVPVRPGDEDAVVGVVGRGVPDLLPVDDPAVPVAHGRRRQPGEVGPGAGLAEELAPRVLAGQQRGEEPLAHGVGAVGEDRRAGQRRAAADRDPDRAGGPQLGVDDVVGPGRQVATEPAARPRRHRPAGVEQPPAPLEQREIGVPRPGDPRPHLGRHRLRAHRRRRHDLAPTTLPRGGDEGRHRAFAACDACRLRRTVRVCSSARPGGAADEQTRTRCGGERRRPRRDPLATTRVRAGTDRRRSVPARTRVLGVRRAAAVVGGGPRRVLGRGDRVPRGPLARSADGDPGRRRDARRPVVPGRHAELRRARAATAGPRLRRRRDRPQPDPGRERADVDRPGALRGRGGGRVARPRGRPRRPGRRLRPEHPRDADRLPRHGLARRHLVELRARVRRHVRRRPAGPDRTGRARRRRRLPLRGQGRRPHGRGRRRRRRPADAAPRRRRRLPARRRSARPARRRRRRVGRPRRHPGRRADVRAPSRPTTRSTSSSARARPGCRRRSSTAMGASSPSTSSSCRCTRTSAPTTSSSGSPPPAG